MESKNMELKNLLKTIQQLRGPDGCPWDIKQTPASLIKYLREEVEELVSAIKIGDTANICEESGDILYILMMVAEINHENNMFSFAEVISEINEKLIRRHPHVFSGKEVNSEVDLRLQWESIKQQEKKRND